MQELAVIIFVYLCLRNLNKTFPAMPDIKLFKDLNIDAEFNSRGFVKCGKIDKDTLQKLIDLNQKLNIPDYFGLGYNVGMNSNIYELRKNMQEGIINIVAPYVVTLLDDYIPYSATFHNKDTTKNLFVPAHQDFSYTREPDFPSVMCWIPLVDVTIENAAIGFIPKSHLFYDYIRAFPFPLAKTPVTENEIRLMKYFEIVPMNAGDIIFFNHKTIHGSFANNSRAERPAAGLSFVKNGEKILQYIFNPKTDGKTILVYEVERDFIARNNNLVLNKMYSNGDMQLSEKLVGEIGYVSADTSWESIERKLNEFGIYPKKENSVFVNQFNRKKRKEKLKAKAYQLFSKIMPSRDNILKES